MALSSLEVDMVVCSKTKLIYSINLDYHRFDAKGDPIVTDYQKYLSRVSNKR